ncbi:biopolymer transporter ExbD [bacterium]|nr:biopolymer transporter ExbD [bacterium]
MKLPSHVRSASIELKMTPMIDVVFLLLVFFLWTSSFDLPEFDLPSAIATPPKGGLESDQAPLNVEAYDEIIIRLRSQEANLEIQFNGEPMESLDQLAERLSAILELGVQPPVIIDPHEDLTMNIAVRVYDLARFAGADRVLFAARMDP